MKGGYRAKTLDNRPEKLLLQGARDTVNLLYKSYLIDLEKMLITDGVHLQVRDTNKEMKNDRYYIAHGFVEKMMTILEK